MQASKFDIAIIGAGPAGVAAALEASKLGKKVLLIERDKVGGTCLNRGCVPTKALLKSSQVYKLLREASEFGISAENVNFDFEKIAERAEQVVSKISAGLNFSLRKSSVELANASAKIVSDHRLELDFGVEKRAITADYILIACGSRPKRFQNLHCDSDGFLYSDGALKLKELPKTATILGGGAIGLEFAQIWGALGVKVKLVEFKERILPLADEDISKSLARVLSKQNVEIYTSAKAKACRACEGGFETEITFADSSLKLLKSDCVLCALGIEANTENLFEKNLGIELDGSFIKTDANFKTNLGKVYACGDAAGKGALAHSAEWEARRIIEHIFLGKPIAQSPRPACVYTSPQAAWVGFDSRLKGMLSEGKCEISKSFYLANAKAQADGATAGFVKLVSESESGKILAASVFGEDACELISIFTLAISEGISKANLAGAMFPHPTLSELVSAACRD